MRAGTDITSTLRHLAGAPGVVEAVLYGSLVRGDYQPGCSDIDIFLVTVGPRAPVRLVESLALAGAKAEGLEPRGVDIAWCTLDEVLTHRCRFKFLTVYRQDFEAHSVLLVGRPVHTVQPPQWAPEDRCRRLLLLLGKEGLRDIVLGEAVKLWLWLRGYRGPWDKWSVMNALFGSGTRGCPASVWRSYVSCQHPPPECYGWAREFLAACAAGHASKADI